MNHCVICGKNDKYIERLENGLSVCEECLTLYGEINRCDCGAPLFGDDVNEIECEACREMRDDEEMEHASTGEHELCERCFTFEAGLDGLCEECESDLEDGGLE